MLLIEYFKIQTYQSDTVQNTVVKYRVINKN